MKINYLIMALLISSLALQAVERKDARLSFAQRQYAQFKKDLTLVQKCYFSRSAACSKEERSQAPKAAARLSTQAVGIIVATTALSTATYFGVKKGPQLFSNLKNKYFGGDQNIANPNDQNRAQSGGENIPPQQQPQNQPPEPQGSTSNDQQMQKQQQELLKETELAIGKKIADELTAKANLQDRAPFDFKDKDIAEVLNTQPDNFISPYSQETTITERLERELTQKIDTLKKDLAQAKSQSSKSSYARQLAKAEIALDLAQKGQLLIQGVDREKRDIMNSDAFKEATNHLGKQDKEAVYREIKNSAFEVLENRKYSSLGFTGLQSIEREAHEYYKALKKQAQQQ